jgi:quercetin dioxygenase-like cupin family protein
MRQGRIRIATLAVVAALAGAAGARALIAQQPAAAKRTILLKQDMTISGREAVMAVVEIPAGVGEGRHVHPAEVFGFILEGTATLEVDGKPTLTLKPGEIFYLAPGQVHQVVNKGTTPVKLSAVFVAEKGKPLTTPAP